MRNLVTNAIDHAESGDVVVRVASDDHAAAIAVRDHGVGLGIGEAAMVFNRFWRADPARARTSGGTGLGLAIVKHVVQNHNGVVKLWSKPGTGSTFTLELPVHVSEPEEDDALEAPHPGETDGHRPHGAARDHRTHPHPTDREDATS